MPKKVAWEDAAAQITADPRWVICTSGPTFGSTSSLNMGRASRTSSARFGKS